MIDWAGTAGEGDAAVVRRNFIANVGDGALYSMAMSLVSQQTVLPVFVRQIGGSNISIGLIPVLWTFGFNFPQIFIARHVQELPRKKRLFLRTAIVQRLPWLLLSIVSFLFLGRVSADVALVLFFCGFGLAAFAGSLNLPVWFDLIASITPVGIRGRLFAARSILGSLLGILGGLVATYVLGVLAFPSSFALLFLLAFCFTMASYLFLLRLDEGGGGPASHPARRGSLLPSLPRVLKTRINFRNFLVADALLITAGIANAFFTVHAFEKFSLPNVYAGAFTIAMMTSMIVASLLLGMLADRYGHRLNLVLSAAAMVIACTIALLAPGVGIYMIAFAGSACTLSVAAISRLPMIAELCTESERPSFVALANMVTSPFVLFGIVAGWLANRVGYEIIFIVSMVLALGAIVWLLRMVEEPRNVALQPASGRAGRHLPTTISREQIPL